METLIVALFTAFATSFANQAGSRTASLLFDQFGRGATPQPNEVAERVEADPGFARQAAAAIDADMEQFPAQAERIIAGKRGLLETLWGASPQQAYFQKTNRCPVGNEMVLLPAFVKPDGTKVSAITFNALRRESPLMRGQCRKGHQWPVFAVETS